MSEININWREVLAEWIEKHGKRVERKSSSSEILTLPYDTSGSAMPRSFYRDRERRRHVDRTIAKWKEQR